MKRLYEKKDHLINKNRNLTSEQKVEIIEILGRHHSYENKIDWNKSNFLTYEDFLKVLRPLYINELDPRGLEEGLDYDIIYKSDGEVLYSVYTYNASKILASNNAGPELWTRIPSWCGEEEKTDEAHAFGYFDPEHENMKPGAKWCISMQTSNKYWNQYSPNIHFLFWFRNNSGLGDDKKIAISVSKRNWKIAEVYNGADNSTQRNLPSYIMEAINKLEENYKEKEFNRIKSRLKLNPQTNRYDYDGDIDKNILKTFKFVSEDKDGFTINFGKITGNFDCFSLDLKSLKGAPQKVGGSFTCHNNQLTSLKGAPKTVGGNFKCSWNNLFSLEGAPQEVGGFFDCSMNQITSLKGAPKKVDEDFNCSNTSLTSLIGAPQKVGWGFYCCNNQLTSLEGAPEDVGDIFDCSYNQLTSLKGAPKTVGGYFNCHKNPNLHSLEGIGEVKGEIYKDF